MLRVIEHYRELTIGSFRHLCMISLKTIIQFKIGGGKSKALSFDKRIACLTTSKALEKSISKRNTYELFSSINVA